MFRRGKCCCTIWTPSAVQIISKCFASYRSFDLYSISLKLPYQRSMFLIRNFKFANGNISSLVNFVQLISVVGHVTSPSNYFTVKTLWLDCLSKKTSKNTSNLCVFRHSFILGFFGTSLALSAMSFLLPLRDSENPN